METFKRKGGIMERILIIGGCGYIGSAIFSRLKTNANLQVDTVDLEWFGNFVNPNNIKKDMKDLDEEFLNSYTTIIILAAHSSPPMAANSPTECVFKNNVGNFISLMSKLKNNQKVIYASSSSVYTGLMENNVTEDAVLKSPISLYDLTKQEIDYYTALNLFPSIQLYGLRFATVGGYSPNQRTDTMLNMMVRTANEKGSIFVVNGQTRRPILYIEDLVDTVLAIINCKEDKRGIYNLSSMNAVIQDIADSVGNKLGITVQQTDEKSFSNLLGGKMSPVFDFSIDSTKVQASFGVKLNATIDTIVDNLQQNFKQMNLYNSSRVNGKYYE